MTSTTEYQVVADDKWAALNWDRSAVCRIVREVQITALPEVADPSVRSVCLSFGNKKFHTTNIRIRQGGTAIFEPASFDDLRIKAASGKMRVAITIRYLE